MLHAEFGEHHYGRVDLTVKPGQKEKALEYFSECEVDERLLDWPVTRREDLDGIKVISGRDRLGDGARLRDGTDAASLCGDR